MDIQHLETGDRYRVFDHLLFKDDISTPLAITLRPCTIVKIYTCDQGRGLIDVIFDHRIKSISQAHFTAFIRIEDKLT